MSKLVFKAMRMAEKAHRIDYKDEKGHFRKAPEGKDRPAYFLHLCEVAWMLQDAGLDEETVAAGYLHDMIEDCEGWDKAKLAKKIDNDTVVKLVSWVTEPGKDGKNNAGNEAPWKVRNEAYIEQLRKAPDEALAISCADKTSNIRDMNRLRKEGCSLDDFLSTGHEAQLDKFKTLERLFEGKVPAALLKRYRKALDLFRVIK